MHVAFLVPSLGLLEGQGNADRELVTRVARAGHTVDVYTSLVPDVALGIEGVRIRKLPRLPTWQLGNQLLGLAASSAMLRPKRYDLVHADAGVTARRADVLVVHTVTDRWLQLPEEIWGEPGIRGAHQAFATRFKARLEMRQARAARAVIANSERTRLDLIERGVDAATITVMAFGVDATHFRPPEEKERSEARARFGLSPEEFVVCFVGAHGPRKGLPLALDAFAEAAPGERLLVAGQHRSGIWAADARARGLPAVMPGKLDDVRQAYWASDVLVYPSRYDAFGMVVLEAMATGLPVVVSTATASHEIVGDAGIVLDRLTPGAIRKALDAFRDDPDRRRAASARARAIAADRTWDIAGATLLDVYERVLAH
jgi:glycosyltransferase involved in cell wall biosynthesis